jgi:hypothetical protein
MTTATGALELVSTGDIGKRFGVPSYVVRKVLDRIDLGQKIGRYRCVAEEDVPIVETALRAAGYLKPKQGVA